MSVSWAYGLTTVEERRKDLFPRTLASLSQGGFDKPHLFIDGCKNPAIYSEFNLEITCRYPNLRTAGHWTLSIAELYIRNPEADRYVIFQDDFVTYKNLRLYLESLIFPEAGYWNLYTFPSNQTLAPQDGSTGFYPSNQLGRGAVALIFNRSTLLKLLSEPGFMARPQDVGRGWKAIDGGIVTALKKFGIKEYVHNPSLVQHTGLVSSMRNKPHQLANSFRGEEFDALTLVTGKKIGPIIDEVELASLRKALADDQERLSKATATGDRAKLTWHIQNYEKKIIRCLNGLQ